MSDYYLQFQQPSFFVFLTSECARPSGWYNFSEQSSRLFTILLCVNINKDLPDDLKIPPGLTTTSFLPGETTACPIAPGLFKHLHLVFSSQPQTLILL